jgi:branched-chain amino acid transport system ATP-binding protein
MLKLNNVEVIYSDVVLVLRGVSLEVPEGKIVSLLGANGAGKTTTLRAISGLLKTQQGKVTRGAIEFGGKRIQQMAPEQIVKNGIIQVMEGRRLFRYLTVEENLQIGAAGRPDRASGAAVARDWSKSTATSPSCAICGGAPAASFLAESSRCWSSAAG